MTTTRTTCLISPYFFLAALSIAYGYCVFQSGGIDIIDWNRCLVGLGLLVLSYFRFTNKSDLAPAPQWWFWWPPLLLLCFVGLQVMPLPMWFLRIVSPSRAALSQSLDPVLTGVTFATISVFPAATLSHLLRFAAYTVVFVLTRELAWRTLQNRWLMIIPIIGVAGVEAGLGVLQYSADVVPHGTYLNRNHFAGLLELSLPFAVVYPIAILSRPQHQSLRQAVLVSLSLVLSALMLLGIILSLSRTAFIASFSSLILVGSLVGRSRGLRRCAVAALVVSILIVASLYLAPDRLIGRFGEVSGATAGTMPDARRQVWKETLNLIADYPLVGCGLGAFEHAFSQYRTFLPQLAIDTVHNDYLQFLAEIGAIGFAIAALGVTGVVLSCAFAIFRSADPATRYVAIACLASLIAILIHSVTDYNLYIPANAMLVAWIAGLVATLNFGSSRFLIT